jgi:hypothetical protein
LKVQPVSKQANKWPLWVESGQPLSGGRCPLQRSPSSKPAVPLSADFVTAAPQPNLLWVEPCRSKLVRRTTGPVDSPPTGTAPERTPIRTEPGSLVLAPERSRGAGSAAASAEVTRVTTKRRVASTAEELAKTSASRWRCERQSWDALTPELVEALRECSRGSFRWASRRPHSSAELV